MSRRRSAAIASTSNGYFRPLASNPDGEGADRFFWDILSTHGWCHPLASQLHSKMNARSVAPITSSLIALPMHGEIKALEGGLRTRDGHLLQWLTQQVDDLTIVSRPEPFPRLQFARARHSRLQRAPAMPSRAVIVSPEAFAPLAPLRGRGWWSASTTHLPVIAGEGAILAWNPFAAAHYLRQAPKRSLTFDFLDDWLVHPAFRKLRTKTELAYAEICNSAVNIFCNSEGTLARAHSFGRADAQLLPNGCDPGRFSAVDDRRSGRTVIGYAGKIGSRVDFALIAKAIDRMPQCDFVLAGPAMDRDTARTLKVLRADCPGDVHYDDYPALLSSFDIGWVPHHVGHGEVGGDAIKLYEYRATGLPSFSAPIIGAARLPGVRVADGDTLIHMMSDVVANSNGCRVAREPLELAREHTWEEKSLVILKAMAPYLRIGLPPK